MKIIRRLLIITIAVLALPVVAAVVFDVLWLAPRIEHIRNLAEAGSSEEQAPTPLTTKMVIAAEPNGLHWQVARILIIQSAPPFEASSTLQRHLVGAATSFLLKAHLSEQEVISIYCARVYVGNNSYGLSYVSHKLFGKNLSKLNATEVATVAAWPRAPNFFERNQESLLRNRDRILNSLASGI